MSKTAPKWLDTNFFTRVVKNFSKDEEAILQNFSIRYGAKAGESFASDLFRVTINYTTTSTDQSKISVIVKTLPEQAESEIDAKRMFLNEMKMYGEFLPDINRIIQKAYGDLKLFPSLIYQTTEPTAAIVLEDLSTQGFATVCAPDDNLETTKMIFHRLAIFHAASFFLAQINGIDYSSCNYSVYHMPESIQESFFKHNLRIFKSLMLSGDFSSEMNDSKYVKRVDEMIEKCTARGKRVFSCETSGYNCLNHGDFFMRNMLFRKAVDERNCDVQFLDFQLSIYASPAVDIFMALYGSMTLKNRMKNRDEMILFYYETFIESLQKFGYNKEPPTLLDLNVELTRCGSLGAQLCICYLPYLLTEFDKVDSDIMYNVNDDTESSKRRLYLRKEFVEVIKEEFEEFYYKGFI
ncbi:hypothetical protein PVAND_004442 [Polypedilum vanderplanki]|uniref:CHK kinase-like domain-containing protein n=1 Tax=Polypedilum vanderplanki TaxID=319348 RepID=A0A9J6BX01_POLVA|nr:hypothetical protein PVAND_004442 [Polypedilum vanderplanki]